MKQRILIVEDDQAIAMGVRDRLTTEGYHAEYIADGEHGYREAVGGAWDLLILDVMLPGKDGLEICRDVRAKGVDAPILMLTARDDITDKVVGLKMGADDYLTKPFEVIELLARGEVIDRDEILKSVWEYESAPFTRTIDLHIAYLRKKLGDRERQELIVTVRGQGYKLAE